MRGIKYKTLKNYSELKKKLDFALIPSFFAKFWDIGYWRLLTKLNHNAFLCFYFAFGLFRLVGLTRKGLRPGTLEFNLRRKKIKAMLPHFSSGLLVEITWRKEIQSCKKRNLCCAYFYFHVHRTNGSIGIPSKIRSWYKHISWLY